MDAPVPLVLRHLGDPPAPGVSTRRGPPISMNEMQQEGVASDTNTKDEGGVYNAEGCDCGCCCCVYSYCYDCGCNQCKACDERYMKRMYGSDEQ